MLGLTIVIAGCSNDAGSAMDGMGSAGDTDSPQGEGGGGSSGDPSAGAAGESSTTEVGSSTGGTTGGDIAGLCGEIDPLPTAVLDGFHEQLVADGRANAISSPHLAAHWLEYGYAGPEASLDTSWQSTRRYAAFELTHDGGNRVFRCTTPGESGLVEPDWGTAASTGETIADGTAEWTFVGNTHTFAGSGDAAAMGEAYAYYGTIGAANRVHDYLEQIGDVDNSKRFLLYTRYARGMVRDTYDRPDFFTPGYRRFPRGYEADLVRWGEEDPDASTVDDLRAVRDNAIATAFAFRNGLHGNFESSSREIAYLGLANVVAERATGDARKLDDGGGVHESNASGTLLEYLVAWSESHLWQWRSGEYDPGAESTRFAPFMFGLTAGFLAEFYEWELENGRDPNAYFPKTHWDTIPEAVGDVAMYLYDEAVVDADAPEHSGEPMRVMEGDTVFFRQDSDPNAGDVSTALHMLFVPAYGFAARYLAEEGECELALGLIERGDAIFSTAALENLEHVTWNGKLWYQSAYHSFDYLRWRDELASGEPG